MSSRVKSHIIAWLYKNDVHDDDEKISVLTSVLEVADLVSQWVDDLYATQGEHIIRAIADTMHDDPEWAIYATWLDSAHSLMGMPLYAPNGDEISIDDIVDSICVNMLDKIRVTTEDHTLYRIAIEVIKNSEHIITPVSLGLNI